MHRYAIKKYFIIPFALGIVFLMLSLKPNFFEIAKQLEIYTTVFKELNLYYVNEINPAEFTNIAIKNTLKNLDPYTNYFDEQEVEKMRIRRESEYAGIGVSVLYGRQGILLNEVYQGFEADKKGLRAGDIITKVGKQALQNMDSDQLSEMLKGALGISLDLEVLRQGETKRITVVTEKIVINPVAFYGLIDNDVGYIVLTRFDQKSSSEVERAFNELKNSGMKKLVLDLRDNPGGSLAEAIAISNFFLPRGSTIVSTKGKVTKWSKLYSASKTPLDTQIPLAILINNRSASASEIVAGALQDHDRAVVLGERSYGKGLVQKYRNLTYGTQLKLTISKYYTPSGRCLQELDYANSDKNGITPKFSEGNVTPFKTKKGRIVFDGGGITPDIFVGFSKRKETTDELVNSRAIFNFTTDYFHKNPSIKEAENFTFTNSDFRAFLDYLIKIDTIFKSRQERRFEEAFQSLKDSSLILKEYRQIQKQLKEQKLRSLSENEDFLSEILKNNILTRYYYKKGVYVNQLKKNRVVLKSVNVLNNESLYYQILKST